jgi:hypothetical protein
MVLFNDYYLLSLFCMLGMTQSLTAWIHVLVYIFFKSSSVWCRSRPVTSLQNFKLYAHSVFFQNYHFNYAKWPKNDKHLNIFNWNRAKNCTQNRFSIKFWEHFFIIICMFFFFPKLVHIRLSNFMLYSISTPLKILYCLISYNAFWHLNENSNFLQFRR